MIYIVDISVRKGDHFLQDLRNHFSSSANTDFLFPSCDRTPLLHSLPFTGRKRKACFVSANRDMYR